LGREAPLVVEDSAAVQAWRNFVFVPDDGLEISLGLSLFFDSCDETVETFKAAELVLVTNMGGVERTLKHRNGFIAGLEGNREWIAVFTRCRYQVSSCAPLATAAPGRHATEDPRHQRVSSQPLWQCGNE
jgi:hypothetical protein